MKFTCLSKGGGFTFPPCQILNVCGFRVLIDVPLDLSALSIFAPVPSNAFDAGDLIRAEPYYKTVKSLHLWNLSFVDVVLVSSPMGILGLPFLTRMKGFSAKIYLTEATAKLGRLMLEDLLAMHMEFRQIYGAELSEFPQWMKWDDLDRLPSSLKEIAMGKDGGDLGCWMPLFRSLVISYIDLVRQVTDKITFNAVDVEDCMKKAHLLKYGEETCYNGTLILKPLSSGLEIGACNWAISTPKGDIAVISSSIFSSGHAMDFDYRALEGNDLIIYSYSQPVHDMDDLENEPDADLSSKDPPSPRSLVMADDHSEESDKLSFICSCAVEAVKTGGSVLVPITRLGLILLLFEQISAALDSSNLQVPIYFISSVAEELLAFTNVIPEWLSRERQEKLFTGEPLFGHVSLVEEKKLHVFPAVHSPQLIKIWQEPCIVFSPSYSLRLGPAAHFLRLWSGNPNSLLVLENEMDGELALLPFKPMEMKILQCSFLSGIKSKKVQPLLELLQPKRVLFPCDLKNSCLPRSLPFPVMHFNENQTFRVKTKLRSSEIQIPMNLASQFPFKKLKDHISVTRLKGDLVIAHGKYRLLSARLNEEKDPKCVPVLLWGTPDIETLLAALLKMGIKGTLEARETVRESDVVALVRIHEPGNAHIRIYESSSVITTRDENLASKIADALCGVLVGI